MLHKNPSERIGIGETWSCIDTLKEGQVKIDYHMKPPLAPMG
jgi:hypothetical protein